MDTDWSARPIDTRESDEAAQQLLGNDEGARTAAAARVTAAPERYNPQVFYVLSAALFADGSPDDAMFWFYAGQLRARYDANRATDELAGVVVGQLNEMFGPNINRHAFQDLDALEATLGRVLEFDHVTPHHYDPRWINRRTPAAMTAALAGRPVDPSTMLRPVTEWSAIAEQTRTDYAEGFTEALRKAKEA